MSDHTSALEIRSCTGDVALSARPPPRNVKMLTLKSGTQQTHTREGTVSLATTRPAGGTQAHRLENRRRIHVLRC